jgi:hypothetical protein
MGFVKAIEDELGMEAKKTFVFWKRVSFIKPMPKLTIYLMQ